MSESVIWKSCPVGRQVSFLLRVVAASLLACGSLNPVWAGGGTLAGPEKLADFEVGVPSGWYVYYGSNSLNTNVITAAAASALARPAQVADNGLLEVTFDITDYGGFGDDFAVVEPQNWTGTAGFSFWFRGTDSGLIYQAEFSDNRSNPATDTAERFDFEFADSFAGWQRITIPWEAFSRAIDFQPPGAPDDGLTLTEVWGWAIVLPTTAALSETAQFDDFGLDLVGVDDFETALEFGTDTASGVSIGFVPFFDGGSTIAVTTGTTPPSPESFEFGSPNQVLRLQAQVNGWAGISRNFANQALDTWTSQDWRNWEGVAFWLYGQNTGTEFFFDIIENRSQGSTSDDAERWTVALQDDFVGWAYFELPFGTFARKEIGNGAPNDGLSLEEVHGWAFGALSTSGQNHVWYLEGVSLFGTFEPALDPLVVQFSQVVFNVDEGAAATIMVELNRPMVAGDPSVVSVGFVTEEASARDDRDFIPAAGALSFFQGGSTTNSFPVQTLNDDDYEGKEGLTLRLQFPTGVALGSFVQAAAVIVDDETFDPNLLDDFVRFPYLWSTYSGFILANPEVTPGPDGEDGPESVLEVLNVLDGGDARFGREFPLGEDWSDSKALGFWFLGQDSGETITVRVHDNREPDPGPFAWELVWNDEFNGPAGTPPDPNHWELEIGDGTTSGIPGWGNSELQTYTADLANAAMDGGGQLLITAAVADGSVLCYNGPCAYTSARLTSHRRAEFAYGRIEARIRLPSGEGLWSAFWSLGNDLNHNPWPASGEIDFMEFVGRVPDEIFGTIHGPGYSGGAAFGNTYDFGEPASANYHTYAVEWQPDRIDWLVDGILFHSAIPADVDPNEWVFNDPVFLLLNLAVGGNFGGPVAPETVFPKSMEVDYVRVYQAPDSAERFETLFVDDSTGWRWIELLFSAFVRSVDQPLGAPDDGFGLNEVWGYELSFPSTAPVASFLFDEFRRIPGWLFVDGFESGDTSGWSGTAQ